VARDAEREARASNPALKRQRQIFLKRTPCILHDRSPAFLLRAVETFGKVTRLFDEIFGEGETGTNIAGLSFRQRNSMHPAQHLCNKNLNVGQLNGLLAVVLLERSVNGKNG